MKILFVSTFDYGGAATATIRLHNSLINSDNDSSILFYKKTRFDLKKSFETDHSLFDLKYLLKISFIKKIKKYFRYKEDQIRIIATDNKWNYPLTFLGDFDVSKMWIYKVSDVINLHWVSSFIDWTIFTNSRKPIFWTLHDMNPFTAVCHQSMSCREYMNTCDNCPQVKCESVSEVSKILETKIHKLRNVKNMHIICPSKWIMNASKSSSLLSRFPHYHIPNGIDTSLYKIYDQDLCRSILNIPKDKIVLLFIAGNDEKLKGFSVLLEAISILNFEKNDFLICNVGSIKNTQYVIDFDKITDFRFLNLLYSSSDAFVLPSLAENFPNTILESLSLGKPVICFNVGGCHEMVINDLTGVLANDNSLEGLVEALRIYKIKKKLFNQNKIRKFAIENFDISIQKAKYLDLFKNVLNNSQKS